VNCPNSKLTLVQKPSVRNTATSDKATYLKPYYSSLTAQVLLLKQPLTRGKLFLFQLAIRIVQHRKCI
jgi:hypothetical protein